MLRALAWKQEEKFGCLVKISGYCHFQTLEIILRKAVRGIPDKSSIIPMIHTYFFPKSREVISTVHNDSYKFSSAFTKRLRLEEIISGNC